MLIDSSEIEYDFLPHALGEVSALTEVENYLISGLCEEEYPILRQLIEVYPFNVLNAAFFHIQFDQIEDFLREYIFFRQKYNQDAKQVVLSKLGEIAEKDSVERRFWLLCMQVVLEQIS